MLLLLFIASSAISIYLSFRYFNLARHLQNIPTAKIRSAPQGYIELIGRAKPIVPVPYYVPESNIPCVWFECEYEEINSNNSDPEIKRTTQSFLIDDGTGACRIDPFAINVVTKSRKSRLTMKYLNTTSRLLSVRWIAVGEVIHAYGRFTTLYSDYQKQEKDLINSRLKALKNDRELMKKFDTNNDGFVDGQEWDIARGVIKKEVNEYILGKQKKQKDKVSENVLQQPDDKKLPYLVSCNRELKVIRRYKLFALGFFLLFLLLSAAIVDTYFLGWLAYELS